MMMLINTEMNQSVTGILKIILSIVTANINHEEATVKNKMYLHQEDSWEIRNQIKKQGYIKNITKKVTLATNNKDVKYIPYRKSSSIKCFRYNEPGYKSPEIPYTFKKLAETEAKELLN